MKSLGYAAGTKFVLRVFDCRALLDFGVFRELHDLSYFKQVRVDGGTVVWPHDQDICPDTLYLDSRKPVDAECR
jgi:hypothetical protein